LKYVCVSCGSATRLGARFLADGGKERFCKKCGAGAGQTAPAKAAHANPVAAASKSAKAKKK